MPAPGLAGTHPRRCGIVDYAFPAVPVALVLRVGCDFPRFRCDVTRGDRTEKQPEYVRLLQYYRKSRALSSPISAVCCRHSTHWRTGAATFPVVSYRHLPDLNTTFRPRRHALAAIIPPPKKMQNAKRISPLGQPEVTIPYFAGNVKAGHKKAPRRERLPRGACSAGWAACAREILLGPLQRLLSWLGVSCPRCKRP